MAGATKEFDAFLENKKQEFILDFYMNTLWKEFSSSLPLSKDAMAVIQDNISKKKDIVLSKEIRDKRLCTRFMCGLAAAVSHGNDGTEQYRPLNYKCLATFHEIVRKEIYPYSFSEKVQMANSIKAQLVLSAYRSVSHQVAQKTFDVLYAVADTDEEVSDDLTELLQSENEVLTSHILKKYSYKQFLQNVCAFLTPLWSQYDEPVLLQYIGSKKETLNNSRISLQLLQTYHDHINPQVEDDFEDSWSSIVTQTHPDVVKWTKRLEKQAGIKASPSGTTVSSTYQRKRASRKRKLKANSDDEKSQSESDDPCHKVMAKTRKVINRLKESARQLDECVKDPYTKKTATDSSSEEKEESSERKSASTVSPRRRSKQMPIKRRWNDAQKDAFRIEWSSDDDNDDDFNPPVALPNFTKNPKPRHKKHPWTTEELEWLVEGVKVLGKGNWAQILRRYPFPTYRTAVHLKDKWRTHNG